jgi:hypothetical protein
VEIHVRDFLLNRLARGENSLTTAFQRAYLWTGDPDHGAGAVFGTICESIVYGEHGHIDRANEALGGAAQEVVMLRMLHPEHRLLSQLEKLLVRTFESGDADLLIAWRRIMASDDLRDDIAAKRRATLAAG